jgi:hypothetical protein
MYYFYTFAFFLPPPLPFSRLWNRLLCATAGTEVGFTCANVAIFDKRSSRSISGILNFQLAVAALDFAADGFRAVLA